MTQHQNWFVGNAESFPGFRMTITFDVLHNLGNSSNFNILFLICSTKQSVAGSMFLICSQNLSSRPVDLLFFKASIHLSRYSIWDDNVSMDSFAYWFGLFSLCGTWSSFPLPLSSRRGATWAAFIIPSCLGAVQSFVSLLIVFHALQLLYIKSVDCIMFCHFLRCDSEISSSRAYPGFTVSSLNGSSVKRLRKSSYIS